MAGRRDLIQMTDPEAAAFLADERTVVCATNGKDGWPHLMPLWYVLRDGAEADRPTLWAWTFAKSQKVRNLERDPRATLQVEAGEDYAALRGVMLETEVRLHHDVDAVLPLGVEIAERYGGVKLPDGAEDAIRAQAVKRVGLEFVETRRSTWDHRKLGGVY